MQMPHPHAAQIGDSSFPIGFSCELVWIYMEVVPATGTQTGKRISISFRVYCVNIYLICPEIQNKYFCFLDINICGSFVDGSPK